MITLPEQIAKAQRELALRRKCSPRLIQQGQLDMTTAHYQLQAQEAIVQTLERLEVDQRQLSLFNQSAYPDSSQGVLWRHLTAIIMKTSLTPWPTTTRPPFPSRTVEIPGKVPSVRAMRCKPGAGLGAGTVWSAPTRTVRRSAQSAPWNSSHGGRWRSVPQSIRM